MAKLFHLQEICLRLMGHDIATGAPKTTSPYSSFKHVASLLLVMSAQYPMASYNLFYSDNLELMTACLSVVFTNMLTAIKIITFLKYKSEFGQMMHSFRQMYKQSQQLSGNSFVTEANKIAQWLGRAYCISCGFTGLYFMLGPIVKMINFESKETIYVRELPMPMKFPFNAEDSPGYEIAFGYIMLVTIVVVFYASAVDGLFISFAINLRAHFQALQQDIRTIDFTLPAHSVKQQLTMIVDYHVLLLNLAKRMCLIYVPIVFGQFFITSLQVGVIIYQIMTHMNSIMDLLVYFSFFASIMLQLFIYCYGGEIIRCESVIVSTAVQVSDWYLAAPTQRRALVFIMMRAQRQTLIKAGFYEATLANFLTICKAALSYITLIQSIE